MTDLTIVYDAATVDIPQVSVTNAMNVTSHGTISQSGQLTVGGSASFALTDSGDVLLASFANDFGAAPTFSGPVQHLALRNTSATAAFPSLPASLTDLTIQFDAAGVQLASLSLTGNLSVSAGGMISQTGALDIQGDSALHLTTTSDIALGTHGNNFVGNVSVTGLAQDVSLQNINATPSLPSISASIRDFELIYPNSGITLSTTSISGNLRLQSGGSVAQTGAISAATSNVTVTAPSADVVLQNASNSLGTSITVASSGAGTVNDVRLRDGSGATTSLSLPASVNDLELQFDSDIDLSAVSVAGVLTVTSRGLTQSGALDVDGGVNLTGVGLADIDLATSANDFSGAMTISGSVNDVAIRNINAIAAVPTLSTTIHDLTLIHDAAAISLPTLTISGDLDLTSQGTVSQTGALGIAGGVIIQLTTSGNVSLGSFANDIGGSMAISGSVQDVDLWNVNSGATVPIIPAGVDNLSLRFDSAGATLTAISVGNDLNLNVAGDVSQTGVVTVGGDMLINLQGGGWTCSLQPMRTISEAQSTSPARFKMSPFATPMRVLSCQRWLARQTISLSSLTRPPSRCPA